MKVSEFIYLGGEIEYEQIFIGRKMSDGKIEIAVQGSYEPIIISDDLEKVDSAILGEIFGIYSSRNKPSDDDMKWAISVVKENEENQNELTTDEYRKIREYQSLILDELGEAMEAMFQLLPYAKNHNKELLGLINSELRDKLRWFERNTKIIEETRTTTATYKTLVENDVIFD